MKIKHMVEKFTDFFFSIVTKKDRQYADVLIRDCCMSYEKQTGDYCSYRKRSGSSEDLIVHSGILSNMSDVAIVMQGPLILENHFTLNTVKLYKRYYPECMVIVSTWKDSNRNEIDSLKTAGAEIVLNTAPNVFGLGNMNFQIVSTRGGIQCAADAGARYILKTRSDQRIYKPHMLEYFKALIEQFPIKKKTESAKQKERIIAVQTTVGGGMFIPYFIADFLYFGTVQDIRNLFDIELDMSPNRTKDERRIWLRDLLSSNPRIRDYYNATAPEIKIVKNYIKKYITENLEDTVKGYWDFVGNYLITVSWDDIGLFWPKYDRYNESNLFRTYSENDNTDLYLQYNWTFQNWLLVNQGIFKYKPEYEKYCMQSCDKLNLKI